MVKTNQVYGFMPDDKYQFLTLNSEDRRYFLSEIVQKEVVKKPRILTLELLNQKCKYPFFADFIGFFSGGLLVNKNIKIKLTPLLLGAGDWISMKYNNEEVFYFHINKYVDILDETRTIFNEINGKKLSVRERHLKKLVDSEATIFRILSHPNQPPLASDKFERFVKSNQLKGLIFNQEKQT